MRNKCKGSGSMAKVTTVFSYQSVDGKRHDFVNCPVCDRQFKAKGECFVPRHVNFEDTEASK
jgi:uncharacterized C2H2 Zn-finger protein